ncbi:hypothetical protein HDU98_009784 [Podochytrium sp. JEL0797]|nr:hypothetical protein HDU98_009784 [Podochytrium sp. JEL0797]
MFAKPSAVPAAASSTPLDVNGEPIVGGGNVPVEALPVPARRESLEYDHRAKRARSDYPASFEPAPFRGQGYNNNYNNNYPSNNYNNSYNNSYNSSYSSRDRHRNDHHRTPEDPKQLDYLVPLRQFSDFLRWDFEKHPENYADGPLKGRTSLSEDDVRDEFRRYREGALGRTMWRFFGERNKDEWFIEKYNPTDSKPHRDQVSQRKLTEALPHWSTDLADGKFDTVSFDAAAKSGLVEGGAVDDGFGGENLKVPKAWDVCALFVKNVPAGVARKEIEEVCKTAAGFKTLLLSDPRADKQFARLGWIVFEEGTDLDAALLELNSKRVTDSFSLALAPQVTQPYRSRLLPVEFSTLTRITTDLALAQRVARSLDLEANIPPEQGYDAVQARSNQIIDAFPPVETAPAAETDAASSEPTAPQDSTPDDPMTDIPTTTDSPTTPTHPSLPSKPSALSTDSPSTLHTKKTLLHRLDLTITYLHRVHWYDYYSGMEAEGPEDFLRRCWIHLRPPAPPGLMEPALPSPTRGGDPRHQSEFHRAIERLEQRVQLRTLNLVSPDSLTTPPWGGEWLLKAGGKSPDAHIASVLASHVQEVESEKFRCGECSKLFRGKEFVTKHLRAKHGEVVDRAKVEVEFFNAYVRDANRVHYPTREQMEKAAAMQVQQQQSQGFGERRGGPAGGQGGGVRRPPPVGRDGRPIVDPRARKAFSYADLDGAPVGDVNELNYD